MTSHGWRDAQAREYEQRHKVKKFVMGLKPSLRPRLTEFDHRTLDKALSTACRKESEMELHQEEKKAQMKRLPKPFQRQNKKIKRLVGDHQPEMELDGKLDAVKILSWRQHHVSLTHVGGNALAAKFFRYGTSFRTCWGRVEELLVARELWIDHKKLIFFPLFVCYNLFKPSSWSRPTVDAIQGLMKGVCHPRHDFDVDPSMVCVGLCARLGVCVNLNRGRIPGR
ncbi:hypothetical protein Taro_051455, partial [Colocasia esculenta]|nr:hypothetical protein [Colocasia esculenta]